ncbi:MAG: dihydroorotase [Bacteroidetes bacterium]|nr:dihydroorotase [Bacteroidota bacterium]MBL7105306.1 dihydroorotase [Bacteroidales bacterium]
MNPVYHIVNATIVNEGEIYEGNVLLKNGIIEKIIRQDGAANIPELTKEAIIIDAQGKYLIPGVIDDQVHFREPGLKHKADIYTESKAAVAGGVTSYMEMPNTVPNTLTQELLEEKYKIASDKSLANYSFYMGASNDNIEEILKTNPGNVCGIKVFMGSSTGNMLVDDVDTLNEIFSKSKLLVAVHCEDEGIIQKNIEIFREKYGENVPIEAHPLIRSDKACYKSSKLAVSLAKIHNTRLHVLHLSTAKEMELFDNSVPLEKKRITSEVCIHHLWFNSTDYNKYGTLIKWNPAVKTQNDRDKLFEALLEDKLDVIATDHSPHTIEEKSNTYFKAPSGGPLVQHSLPAMLDFFCKGKISLEKIVEKMCHAPAVCFQVEKRGFIREGYWADLSLIDIKNKTKVEKSDILYKCGWSPFEGHTFNSKVTHTFVNGNLVYENGKFNESVKGQRLLFER